MGSDPRGPMGPSGGDGLSENGKNRCDEGIEGSGWCDLPTLPGGQESLGTSCPPQGFTGTQGRGGGCPDPPPSKPRGGRGYI